MAACRSSWAAVSDARRPECGPVGGTAEGTVGGTVCSPVGVTAKEAVVSTVCSPVGRTAEGTVGGTVCSPVGGTAEGAAGGAGGGIQETQKYYQQGSRIGTGAGAAAIAAARNSGCEKCWPSHIQLGRDSHISHPVGT